MNWPTAIIAAVIAFLFVIIVACEIKKRKSGKGSCSCGCSGCTLSDICHSDGEKES